MSNRRPRRLIRWAARLLVALVCLLGLLWLFQTFFLPGLVRGQVLAQLETYGFTGSSLEVTQVSPFSATVKDLRAGDAISARIVNVTYSPRDLLAGRVDDIVVNGLIVRPDRLPASRSTGGQISAPFQSLTVTDAELELPTPSGDIRIPATAAIAEQEDHQIHAALTASYEGLTLSVTGVSDLQFQSASFTLRTGGSAQPILDLFQPAGVSAQNVTFDLTADGAWSEADRATVGIKITDGALKLSADQLAASGAMAIGLAADIRFQAAGTGDNLAAALLPNSRISIKEFHPPGDSRPFGVLIRPKESRLTVLPDEWSFRTDGADIHAGDLHVVFDPGRVTSINGRMIGEVSSTLDLATLSASQLVRAYVPGLDAVELEGKARLSFSRAPGGEISEGGLVLQMIDATIASQGYELTAQGIDAHIVLIDPFNPHSPPGQRLSMKYAKMGKWEVVNGLFQFTLRDLATLDVEKTELGWAAGRLWTDPYTLSLTSPIVSARVQGTELDLNKVVWVVSGETAWGQGLVDLSIPITINWPNMRFGDGFVEARPGGLLNLDYAADQVGKYLVDTDPRFATDPTYAKVRDRVVDALRNFRFSKLRLEMKRNETHLDTVIEIKGKGDTAGGQELNLNLNVNDIDYLLSRYLALPK